jgi:hypothetical protein
MSNLLVEKPPVVPMGKEKVSPAVDANRPPPKGTNSRWNWLLMTCLLLSISGGIRHWRDRQFRSLENQSAACPFPLDELPTAFGTWRMTGQGQLDDEISKLAGSTAHILRSYTDSKTGETVSVLVVYGLAYSVFGHSPEVCYPAGGYQAVGKAEDHEFSLPGSATPVRYRSKFFSKTLASITRSHEVMWSFWHAGSWLPDVSDHFKTFRSSPALFKIQVECPVTGTSSEHSPVESLVKALTQEINIRRAKAAMAAATAPVKNVSPTSNIPG